jgi:hypothetical protein
MRNIAKCIYKDLERQSPENLNQRFVAGLLNDIKKEEFAGTAKYAVEAYKEWKDTILKDHWNNIITELSKTIEQKKQTPTPHA